MPSAQIKMLDKYRVGTWIDYSIVPLQENKMPTVLINRCILSPRKIDGCGVCGLRVGKRIDKTTRVEMPISLCWNLLGFLSSVLSRAAAAINDVSVHELHECSVRQETRSCKAYPRLLASVCFK